MNRITIIVLAVLVVAGAFPQQSTQLIAQISTWLNTITLLITPGQQTALLLLAVIVGLFALSR